MSSTGVVILAGGLGSRLDPLTKKRAKPAVPFAGKYRIIDWALSNAINSSGISDIKVLTQKNARSLDLHVRSFNLNNFFWKKSIETIFAQNMVWYSGTADAVFQNLDFIRENPNTKDVAILAGDHAGRFDIAQVRKFYNEHQDGKPKFIVCVLKMPTEEAARNFGVVEVDENMKIIGFEEKPASPKEIPGEPGFCLGSLGIYFADLDFLSDILKSDSENISSSHDFGKDVIPDLIAQKEDVFAYDCSVMKIPGQDGFCWLDLGRPKEYHEANIELVKPWPNIDIYNPKWPLISLDQRAPAKHTGKFIVSGGTIFDGDCDIELSVFGRGVKFTNSSCTASVFFDNVYIENSQIQKAIIDQNNHIVNMRIGFDQKEDKENGIEWKDGIPIVPYGKFPG